MFLLVVFLLLEMVRPSKWLITEREQLIDLVAKNPSLWQTNLPEYLQKEKLADIWTKIRSVLSVWQTFFFDNSA